MDTSLAAKRLELWAKASKNPKLQAVEIALCKKDPVYWFNHYAWTNDPRDNPDKPKKLPFALYDFQEWFIRELETNIRNGKSLVVEKSRDMGATWMIMGMFLWGWQFEGWSFHCGSRRETEVDGPSKLDPTAHLFGKFRYMLYNQPKWMRPGDIDWKVSKNDAKLSITNPDNGASLTGESANPAFGRQLRKKAVFLDEFNFWEAAENALGACQDTAPCQILNSSVEGETTSYARRANDDRNIIIPYPKGLEMIKEKGALDLCAVPPKRALSQYEPTDEDLASSRWRVYTLWWPIHPGKSRVEYKATKENKSEDKLASEWDINYSLSVSGRVFNQFKEHRHVMKDKHMPYDRRYKLYRIWDFGRVNATLYMQVDEYNRKRILLERILENSNTPDQLAVAQQDEKEYFPGARIIDICDPAGSYQDERGNSTDIDILEDAGVYPEFDRILHLPHRTRKERGLERIKVDLQKTPKGEEGFKLWCPDEDTGCPVLKKAFEGGYAYKKDISGNLLDKVDEKHPYEDVMDNLIYFYIQTDNEGPNIYDDLSIGGSYAADTHYIGY